MKIFSFSSIKATEHGQALVLIAISFIAVLAFVGLAMDAGVMFIAMGNLRRATDAGALAAAAQFREGRTPAELEAAALSAIAVNGISPSTVTVELCDLTDPDPFLCATGVGGRTKKMVRVTATAQVQTAFLRVIGIRQITLSANSVSEAASMDVVLVIDISESMTFEADENPLAPGCQGTMCDPNVCNYTDIDGSADGYPGECQPFEKVKESAINFVSKILNLDADVEQDRISIVTFADGWNSDPNRGTHFRHPWNTYLGGSPPAGTIGTAGQYWTSDRLEAIEMIKALITYNPPACNGTGIPGPCRMYNESGDYMGAYCEYCDIGYNGVTDEWSPYMTTNIGGGLQRGGIMFAHQTREDALWIVVLLTDGLSNASNMNSTEDNITNILTYPIGFCPEDDTLCQDTDVTTRHYADYSVSPPDYPADYDSDDFARDMADYVGCLPDNPADACTQDGQGAVIFTVGLGPEVTNNYAGKFQAEVNGKAYGASLLRYIAAVGDDADPATDPCAGIADPTEWCGNYYFSPSGAQLNRVFEAIASRIFTRIAR